MKRSELYCRSDTFMDRSELNCILEKKHYLKGGTKEACVKVKEYLSHAFNPGNQLHSPLSCVNTDEFVEAVNVLLAFASRSEDTIP